MTKKNLPISSPSLYKTYSSDFVDYVDYDSVGERFSPISYSPLNLVVSSEIISWIKLVYCRSADGIVNVVGVKWEKKHPVILHEWRTFPAWNIPNCKQTDTIIVQTDLDDIIHVNNDCCAAPGDSLRRSTSYASYLRTDLRSRRYELRVYNHLVIRRLATVVRRDVGIISMGGTNF